MPKNAYDYDRALKRCKLSRQVVTNKKVNGEHLLSQSATRTLKTVAQTLCQKYAEDMKANSGKSTLQRAYRKRLRDAELNKEQKRVKVTERRKEYREKYPTNKSNAWTVFVASELPRLKKNMEANLKETDDKPRPQAYIKMLAARWKNMSDEAKEPYRKESQNVMEQGDYIAQIRKVSKQVSVRELETMSIADLKAMLRELVPQSLSPEY